MDSCITRPQPSPLPLYEQEQLHQITGGLLRPGGTALTTQLLTLANLPERTMILDVGCGAGHTLQLLQKQYGFTPVGLDPSAAMVAKSKQQAADASVTQGTATALPYATSSFDGVIAECSLSLTENTAASVAEMNRVLRPGGKLLLSDIYRKKGPAHCIAPEISSCINTLSSLDAMKQEMEVAGFLLCHVQDCTSLLKQLAGQLIFSFGSMEAFWQLFMDRQSAQRTCSMLTKVSLGYYALVAEKRNNHG